MEPSNLDYDCTLLECHVNLDLSGFEDMGEDGEPTGIKVPYIVTISEDNGQILSIRRNFREDDDRKKKIQYFVHYQFLPGFGFYGLGLIHTIGGLSRTATAALRQLIDAVRCRTYRQASRPVAYGSGTMRSRYSPVSSGT